MVKVVKEIIDYGQNGANSVKFWTKEFETVDEAAKFTNEDIKHTLKRYVKEKDLEFNLFEDTDYYQYTWYVDNKYDGYIWIKANGESGIWR